MNKTDITNIINNFARRNIHASYYQTLDEVIHRAKNIAAPLTAKRAGFNPPCVELNKCIDGLSDQRVCNSLVTIEGQPDKNRIRVFIVEEEIGF